MTSHKHTGDDQARHDRSRVDDRTDDNGSDGEHSDQQPAISLKPTPAADRLQPTRVLSDELDAMVTRDDNRTRNDPCRNADRDDDLVGNGAHSNQPTDDLARTDGRGGLSNDPTRNDKPRTP